MLAMRWGADSPVAVLIAGNAISAAGRSARRERGLQPQGVVIPYASQKVQHI
jgi:hypothetical protein